MCRECAHDGRDSLLTGTEPPGAVSSYTYDGADTGSRRATSHVRDARNAPASTETGLRVRHSTRSRDWLPTRTDPSDEVRTGGPPRTPTR